MENEYVLELHDIVKEFSGVRVLFDVNLKVKKGEIHALVGENGAGKSTLMKILSGVYPFGTYSGQIKVDGQEVKFHNIKEAEHCGIEIINQELEVVPEMTVSENVFLGNEITSRGMVDYNKMTSITAELLKKVDLKVNTNTLVETLGVGKRQLVVIAKSLSRKVRILLMDEPTAALTESETEKLMEIIRELKNQGVTCIYISHKLNEVLNIADSITILRDGKTITTQKKEDMTEESMIKYMVGREMGDRFPREPHAAEDVIFELKNYSFTQSQDNKKIVNNVSLALRKGEVLGISGLMGAGRTELVMSLIGAIDGKATGQVILEGKEIKIKNPIEAIEAGIGMVVEDRKDKGLVLCLDIAQNTTLSSLKDICNWSVINENEEISRTRQFVKSMNIKAASIETEVGRLSGGNQQKVVIAKAIMTKPKVLIMDEPTRGIDIGAKREIYLIINELLKSGVSIILISSELPEVIGISDRILVMREGEITGEVDARTTNQEEIIKYATLRLPGRS